MGRLFAEKLGEPFSAEHRNLTDIARRHLREEYLQAGMGISGCNFAVADTGTMVVVENEGNAGLSTATPPVHVALMGIEKMLPRIDDLPLFLNLLARSGTGQKLTTYTHLIHGADAGPEAVRHPAGQRAEQRAEGPGGLVGACTASAAGRA